MYRGVGLLLSAMVLGGCTGEVLQRLEQDIAVLRERIQAREEVRIQVASATAPPTTVKGTAAATEPHVSVGCPPVVAAVETVRAVKYVKARHSKHRSKPGRGKGRR
jgi:hypothetical protein